MSGDQKSNRREFLKGHSLAQEVQRRINNPIDSTDANSTNRDINADRQSEYLQQFSKTAMACQFEILFNMQQFDNAAELSVQAFEIIDQLESQLTIYRDDSEMSKINREASIRPVSIETGLFELLQRANELSTQTGGAFDMTAGPLSQLWGFEQRVGQIPDEAQLQLALQSVGGQLIELNLENQTARFHHPGVRINLGGIGKGYAIDRAANHLLKNGITSFVIHGGQSSVKAFGTQFVSAQPTDSASTSNGWVVGLSHPTIPDRRLAEIYLNDQALGTSGTGRQGFYHQGKRYGHIIDPRTGWPTQHILSSTVITESAARADALATAFFVMTLEEIQEYCDSNPEVKAIIVLPEQQSGAQRIETFNFDVGSWRTI